MHSNHSCKSTKIKKYLLRLAKQKQNLNALTLWRSKLKRKYKSIKQKQMGYKWYGRGCS